MSSNIVVTARGSRHVDALGSAGNHTYLWDSKEVLTEEGLSHPSGDLDAELEQLGLVESTMLPMMGSCGTNGTAACSGGVCCL